MTLASHGIHFTMAQVGEMSAREVAALLDAAKAAERRRARRRGRR